MKPLVAAHRGLSAEEPENTLAAFRAAQAVGFNAVELDVRLTHDGHVVVLHDPNIARTTDGVGRVSDFDLAELQTHHTADGPVPTLDAAMEALAGWTGTWNIEVKAHHAAAPAVDVAEAHGIVDRCIITSMDPRALEEVKDRNVRRGLIVLGPPDEDDLEACEETGCSWIMVDHTFLVPAVMDQARAAGLQVGAWTVNDPARAKEVVALGAAMVITDTRVVLTTLH